MALTIVNQSKSAINKNIINVRYKKIISALKKLRIKNKSQLSCDITLIFLDSSKMKALNKQFRGRPYATDVLTFSANEESQLGEIAICLPIAKVQAKSNRHSFNDEVTYLLLHGILHCLGYDHEDPRAPKKLAEQMFRIQDKVFLNLQNQI